MDALCLLRDSPAYPPRLRDIPDSPSQLWVRGQRQALDGHAVAVVGSRRASPGALETARRLASGLAGVGLTIVSGLARGCDAAAHRGALDAGGRTVAVLGSGLDVIYPPEHGDLADEIAGHGAVVSELPPGSPPLPHHFRRRNRLISGLSVGVVVIEANERSGSLITAGYALAQGREVMVVPGTVHAGRNRGGHLLIRDGAALVENAEDVLAVLVHAMPLPAVRSEPVSCGAEAPPPNRDVPSPHSAEEAIVDPVLDALDPDDPQDFDQLSARLPLSTEQLLARLAELELSGQVRRVAGGRFLRSLGKVIT
jgi:DNA processing protein